MTPQLDKFLKALRDLPYQDMMKVADIVATQLMREAPDALAPDARIMAAALSDGPGQLGGVVSTTEEEKVLREALGNRKRSILIYRMGSGWRAELASVETALGVSQTQAPELRMALNQMLDQLAAGYVMLK